MNFDFSALLVFLSFASGSVWLAYVLFVERKAKPEKDGVSKEKLKMPLIVEYSKSFFPIFFIVLILRSFLVEPFKIPSASMMPTLLIGDFILVNKYEYGLRLPVLHTKIVDNKTADRGDIVVFRYPEDPSIPFIKRVVGIPGDKIAYRDKVLYINDKIAVQDNMGKYIASGAGMAMSGYELIAEALTDNINHQILVDPRTGSIELEVIVPEGNYFVLGDNRDNSKDSRFWGFVPDENLMGRAFMIWMNWDGQRGGIDFERIGRVLN